MSGMHESTEYQGHLPAPMRITVRGSALSKVLAFIIDRAYLDLVTDPDIDAVYIAVGRLGRRVEHRHLYGVSASEWPPL